MKFSCCLTLSWNAWTMEPFSVSAIESQPLSLEIRRSLSRYDYSVLQFSTLFGFLHSNGLLGPRKLLFDADLALPPSLTYLWVDILEDMKTE